MYRTDHAHRWERTSYEPMSSSYARTLFDYSGALMTGDTRPAEFGHTKDGDLVEVRRSGFAVDINTDAMPLDVLAQRLEPGSIITDLQAEQALRNEAARIAGARMGGGDQEPSAPVPLAWTGARVGNFLGDIVGFAIVAALAVGAWALLLSGVPR